MININNIIEKLKTLNSFTVDVIESETERFLVINSSPDNFTEFIKMPGCRNWCFHIINGEYHISDKSSDLNDYVALFRSFGFVQAKIKGTFVKVDPKDWEIACCYKIHLELIKKLFNEDTVKKYLSIIDPFRDEKYSPAIEIIAKHCQNTFIHLK